MAKAILNSTDYEKIPQFLMDHDVVSWWPCGQCGTLSSHAVSSEVDGRILMYDFLGCWCHQKRKSV